MTGEHAVPRLVVTGSRHGHPAVDRVLSAWLARHGAPEMLIVGDARGVDRQAWTWALAVGLEPVTHRHAAQWRVRGVAAGPIRNGEMIAMAGPGARLVAFPCVRSIGTWDCVQQANRAGLHVYVVPVARD